MGTSKSKESAGTAESAKAAIADAEKRGDVRAAKSIGQCFLALEAKKEELKNERGAWRTRIQAAEAGLSGSIKADDDGSPAGARAKLNKIVLAYQDVEEAESGRKSALHLLIEEKKELSARLKKQIEGAKQLGLFD